MFGSAAGALDATGFLSTLTPAHNRFRGKRIMSEQNFEYHPMFPLGADQTEYRKLSGDHVATTTFNGAEVLTVDPQALTELATEAFKDINHLLRPGHLKQLASILDDPEASDNDRFVAYDLLKNANIAAGGILPMCQDTGTAIIMGKKGQNVWTGGGDEEALSKGVFDSYTQLLAGHDV
jgi:fumarate hydratase class I